MLGIDNIIYVYTTAEHIYLRDIQLHILFLHDYVFKNVYKKQQQQQGKTETFKQNRLLKNSILFLV